ncbi:MAG: rhomboid family intramembrane serine protease [Chitinophagaceae bacterium]|jgi:membrane associated rhomboid family serine protease|nr:rhomboid family intramembrane serine protease [Chitinophagaceae bacterium]
MREFRPGGFQVLPPLVKNIIIINVLVFAAQNFIGNPKLAIGDFITDEFALHSWNSPLFRFWQPFTYMFMHGGFSHILFNMFAVWMFGSVLENVWGAKRFLFFYIVCGLGAAVAQLLVQYFQQAALINEWNALKFDFNPTSFQQFYVKYLRNLDDGGGIAQSFKNWIADPSNNSYADTLIMNADTGVKISLSIPTIGASGSVFGLLVAFGYLFPNTLISIYFLFPVKAKWFVLGYAAIELFNSLQNSATDNVAHVAHLGGALIGFILVFIWNKTNRQQFY